MRASMIVIALAFVFSLDARPAQACSCVRIEGCGAIRANDVVFEATVESITLEPPPVAAGTPGFYPPRYIVRFKDIKELRGKSEPLVFMTKGNSCDYTGFEVGTRYVIHAAVIAEGYISASACGMTGPIESAKSVLACLKRD